MGAIGAICSDVYGRARRRLKAMTSQTYCEKSAKAMSETRKSAPNICVIADMKERAEIREYLLKFEFSTIAASSLSEAAVGMQRRPTALCILDLDTERLDAASVVHKLAQNCACPLIVVSSNQDVADRVLSLELGADDYLVKPLQLRELVARIRSVIRRSERIGLTRRDDLTTAKFGDWVFNTSTLELSTSNGRSESLTAAEANLLKFLLKNPNRLLTRDQLQGDDVWGDDPAYARSIDVRVSRIRKKIETDPRTPRFIKTVYGAGYILSANVVWM